MARGNFPLQTFNRGRVSRLGLARTDLDRTRLSAEVQTNWVPRTIGSMMVRPALQYIGATQSNNQARLVPFIRSSTDTALVEVSSGAAVVWVSDALITRPNSTSVFTNGLFDSSTSLLGWTDADESGSTSEWVTGNYMGLTGTRFARAIRRQTVTAGAGDHGVAVNVERGRPVLKIGSSAGGDDYFEETTLRPGAYSLKVTSTGNFDVEFSANTEYRSLVSSIAVESSGTMSLSAPWQSTDLSNLRWKQSGDVIFVATDGYQQRRIERHAPESWSLVQYEPENGPFRTINTSGKRLNPSALKGDITLSADQPVFNTNHTGALFEITSIGQDVDATITGADQWSDSIRVSGVAETRVFDIIVAPISTDITVRVQRSVGEEGNWGNITGLSWTSSTATTHEDGLDNQIVFYRVGSGSTDFVSTSTAASAGVELNYASGGITGVAKITAVSGATESSAIVLTNFGSTDKSELWSEGAWSDFRGWPTSNTLHEGRMSWSGRGQFWASVSDSFENFDATTEGDSAPIKKTIGEGPTDKIEWMLSLTRLLLGSQGQEFQAKTSSLEEPLTPTNFSLRDVATQGSANVQAAKIDKAGYFVQQGGTRVYEIGVNQASLEFDALDRTILIPEMGEPGINRMVAQRQPDTRLHCVRSDGTVAMMVRDPAENVLAWIDIESSCGVNGAVEEAAVLPGTVEDNVYYVVRREINGSTVRYLEKWAQESEARGDSTNKIGDSLIVQNSTSTTTVTASHLIGASVVLWGNTKDLGTYTVSTLGTITASEASTSFYLALPYSARFRSAKLAYAAEAGTALTKKKKIDQLGVVLADTHARGIQYGPSSTALSFMPRIESSGTVSTDAIWTAYDQPSFEFDGSWDTDSRMELWGQAPRPATVLASIITIDTKG